MPAASEEGLRTTVLPATSAAVVMPVRIARGKFQGGITTRDAHRDVLEIVAFAGVGRQGLRLGESLHLPRVELAEVDGLGRVAVGFGPRLGLFEDHHGRELVLAPADRRGDAEDERRALLDAASGPIP